MQNVKEKDDTRQTSRKVNLEWKCKKKRKKIMHPIFLKTFQ